MYINSLIERGLFYYYYFFFSEEPRVNNLSLPCLKYEEIFWMVMMNVGIHVFQAH